MGSSSNFDDKTLPGNSLSNSNAYSNMGVELCLVCGDRASGRHYGAISCEGCKGFFKRSIRKQLGYQCRGTMNCEVTKHHRNRCQFCRLQKCLASGMRSDSVQHERKPISEKKDNQSPSNNFAPTSAPSSSNSLIFSFQQRQQQQLHKSKLLQQQYHLHQTNSPGGSSSSLNLSENLSTATFPIGLNFPDLTQNIGKRSSSLISNTTAATATSYHQQQQRHEIYLCSPGNQTNDEDSGNNCISGRVGKVSLKEEDGNMNTGIGAENLSQSVAAAIDNALMINSSAARSFAGVTGNFIQSSIKKSLISQHLELVSELPMLYENFNTNGRFTIKEDLCFVRSGNDERSNNGSITTTDETINFGRFVESIKEEEEGNIFEQPLLLEANVAFNLQIPNIVPPYLNVHYVCEIGSRVLFNSINWIKRIHSFNNLPEDIQAKLLRKHWAQLFVIGLSQSVKSSSMAIIITTLVGNIIQLSELIEKADSANKIRKFCQHTSLLHEFVQAMNSMNLDEYEYAFIRLILVFSLDLSIKSREKRLYIQKLQEYSIRCLGDYLRETMNRSDAEQRSNRILLWLMQLSALESEIIEELFFSKLIDQVQIESMIPYLLKLGGGEI